jgi:hypothetical protein
MDVFQIRNPIKRADNGALRDRLTSSVLIQSYVQYLSVMRPGYVVGKATPLRTGRFGVRIPVVQGTVSVPYPSRPGPRASPVVCLTRIEAVSRRKQPERGVDHPPRCSAEVKNEERYMGTSTSSLYLHYTLRGDFIFTCAKLPQNISIPE